MSLMHVHMFILQNKSWWWWWWQRWWQKCWRIISSTD